MQPVTLATRVKGDVIMMAMMAMMMAMMMTILMTIR
jgi:ABC-type uncharacterized transport system permease subunit